MNTPTIIGTVIIVALVCLALRKIHKTRKGGGCGCGCSGCANSSLCHSDKK